MTGFQVKITRCKDFGMTHTQQLIEVAIKGGWKLFGVFYKDLRFVDGAWELQDYEANDWQFPIEVALLDPLFWQALGKEMGLVGDGLCPYRRNHESPCDYCDNTWKDNWHSLIDTLASGGTIEQWADSILKGKK